MDVHRKTGEVVLHMKCRCGFIPIIGWPDIEGVRELGELLLGFYDERKQMEKDRNDRIAGNLLLQALGDDGFFEDEE